jgi:hypothetical protein
MNKANGSLGVNVPKSTFNECICKDAVVLTESTNQITSHTSMYDPSNFRHRHQYLECLVQHYTTDLTFVVYRLMDTDHVSQMHKSRPRHDLRKDVCLHFSSGNIAR